MNEKNSILTKKQLSELDMQIDELVPSFGLLRTNRRLALRSILTEFDVIIQRYGLQPDLAQRILDYRVTYQALDHAVRWIFDHCPLKASFVPTNPQASAIELLSFARDYHYIFVQMSLAFKERNEITRINGNKFLITSANNENERLETARSLMAVAQFPDTHEEATDFPAHLADELRKAISIDGIKQRQLRYTFKDSEYAKASSTMETRRLYDWSMNPEWDLGGYSFGDVQDVWKTLKTLQSLHQLALQKLPRQQDRRRFNLKIRTSKEWVMEISKYAGVDNDIVMRVFSDLVYNPDLQKRGYKKGHVMYQPFFELGPDEIVQSNALVMMSVVEKCSWILTELLRPKLHGRLRNSKELYWIETEFKSIESERIKVFPHLRFTHEGRPGDLDLLILDVFDNFGLVSQLKWTTSTDNVTGVESDDRQYAAGVEQAIRSLHWAENNRVELARRTNMSESMLKSTTFLPIVIAKETLPSGTFESSNVPVINEALFRWILKDPHRATLKQLWEIASNSDYLPKEGVHFERNDPPPLSWGTIEFCFDNVSYIPLRRWNPTTDIVVP